MTTSQLTTETKLPPFMQFPKFLIDINISDTAKLIYILMYDRTRLSLSQNWIDDTGNVYIYYTIKNFADTIRCSEMTVKNMLKNLEGINLIERKKQGFGKPNIIYVKLPLYETEISSDTDNIYPSREINIIPHDRQNLSTNKNNFNKSKSIKTNLLTTHKRYDYNNEGSEYSL